MPKKKTKSPAVSQKKQKNIAPKAAKTAKTVTAKATASKAKRAKAKSTKNSSPRTFFLIRLSSVLQWIARHQRWLAVAGLVLGVQMVLASGWYLLYRRTVLSFQVVPVVTSEVRKEAPTRIIIHGANYIDVPVAPAVIKEGIWEVSHTTASHLATSAYPGQESNIVVYGHNLKTIFASLVEVKPGDLIEVYTDTNDLHEYRVEEIMTVNPTDIEVVLPTDHEVLTVYTCTGFLDSKRFIVRAKPVTS